MGRDTLHTTVPGQRTTRQRTAVVRLLDQLQGFRSAQHLHELLRERGEDHWSTASGKGECAACEKTGVSYVRELASEGDGYPMLFVPW